MLLDIVLLFVDKLKEKTKETIVITPVCNKQQDYIVTIGAEYFSTIIYCNGIDLNIVTNNTRYEFRYWWEFDLNRLDSITDVIIKIHEEKGIWK